MSSSDQSPNEYYSGGFGEYYAYMGNISEDDYFDVYDDCHYTTHSFGKVINILIAIFGLLFNIFVVVYEVKKKNKSIWGNKIEGLVDLLSGFMLNFNCVY